MPGCEICGKDTELFHAVIEGTDMQVCTVCGKFGKIIKKVMEPIKPRLKGIAKEETIPEKEIIQVVVPEYAEIIKKKREELGLKQEEFAQKISEKESLIHHIESGKFEPNVELARKMEKFLKVKLIEEQELSNSLHFKAAADQVTIGDLIKIKKKE